MNKANYQSTNFFIGLFLVFAFFGYSDYAQEFLSKMMFDRQQVLSGEVWRVFSYAFIQHRPNVFFLLLHILVFAYIAMPLEERWGTFFFLQVMFVSLLGGALAGILLNIKIMSGLHLDVTLMLIHGYLFRESMILLFFILPVKILHLGIFGAILMILQVLPYGPVVTLLYTIPTFAGFLYFFAFHKSGETVYKVKEFVKDGGVKGIAQKKSALDLFNKGMKIAEQIKKSEASNEDQEWVNNLDQDVPPPDFPICSPYTYDPESKICPPCPAFKICLKRHIKNEIEDND